MHRAGLADGVRANELDRVGVGRIVLLVVRRTRLERDPQLLEDRPALRRRRGEDEPHRGFSATQISSAGQRRAQSAVTEL